MVERTWLNPPITHLSLLQMRLKTLHDHIPGFERFRIIEVDHRLVSAKHANDIDAFSGQPEPAGHDSIDSIRVTLCSEKSVVSMEEISHVGDCFLQQCSAKSSDVST